MTPQAAVHLSSAVAAGLCLSAAALSDRIDIVSALLVAATAIVINTGLSPTLRLAGQTGRSDNQQPVSGRSPSGTQASDAERQLAQATIAPQASIETVPEPAAGPQVVTDPVSTQGLAESSPPASERSAVQLARYRRDPVAAQRPQCPQCGRSTVARTGREQRRCQVCACQWAVAETAPWPVTVGDPTQIAIDTTTQPQRSSP